MANEEYRAREEIGFYSLAQLYTCRETKRLKKHVGIFPWGKNTILRMVARGEFPAPIKGIGKINLWPKEVIHDFIENIKERGREK